MKLKAAVCKSTKIGKWNFASILLVLLAVSFGSIFTTRVNAASHTSQLHEAMYLFEMKGEFTEAEAILEDISKNGDPEDRAQADFLLAKIKDLSRNKAMATFYYTQNLREENKTSQIYWVAERLAELQPEPERLLEKKIKLNSSMQTTFNADSLRILLANKSVFTPASGKYQNLPAEISASAQLIDISANGTWWLDGNTLHFSPSKKNISKQEIALKKKLGSFKVLNSFSIGFIDGAEFVLFQGNIEKFRTQARFEDCAILEKKSDKQPIILNCPDNALHVLSKDNGEEIDVIPMLDPIAKTFIEDNGILFFSSDALWFYSMNNLKSPLWRKRGVIVEKLLSFENYFAVLESSGELLLVNKQTGETVTRRKTSAANLVNLNKGLLGLLSGDGAIIATDTALVPLWMFHFGKAATFLPWVNDGKLYYPSSSDSIKVLNILHYGKKPILSQVLSHDASIFAYQKNWDNANMLADSSLEIEPGNAEALFVKALYLEENDASAIKKSNAWAKTIGILAGTSEQRIKILEHYSKIIKAKHVVQLPLSPHTLYPSFISYKKLLLTLDPASRQLVALSAENGKLQWNLDIGKLESAPVTANRENMLAFASGFSLRLINLDNISKSKNMELPGKAFHMIFSNNALYISTWNGFLLKVMLPDFKLAWTRKIGTTPFYTIAKNQELITAGLNGTIQHVSEISGQKTVNGPNLQAPIAQVLHDDSLQVFLSNDQRIFVYRSPDEPLMTISPSKDILSANLVKYKEKKYLIASFADQEIRLYSLPEGAVVWNFQGKKSLFGKMALYNDTVWIDQGKEVVGISIETGKIASRFQIPGGAGTVFISGETLYSATPQRLLYFFNLQ